MAIIKFDEKMQHAIIVMTKPPNLVTHQRNERFGVVVLKLCTTRQGYEKESKTKVTFEEIKTFLRLPRSSNITLTEVILLTQILFTPIKRMSTFVTHLFNIH